MTFSTLASPGVSLQGGGGSGGGGGGTPGGSNTQIQYNSSGTFAGASGLTTNGTELTIASGTKTADAPVLDMSQTWNNAAVTFTGLKLNVTDTASNAASLLMDLQVGGTSRVKIGKNGWIYGAESTGSNALVLTGSAAFGTVCFGSTTSLASIGQFGVRVRSSYGYGWSADENGANATDLVLTRRGTANLRLGAADAAAPVAQTLSVQSVVAGTTNTAGANLTITGSQGTGTGAGGSIIFQVAPAGSSGTAQNALVDTITIASNGQVTFPRTGVAQVRADGEGFTALASGTARAGFSQFGCRLTSGLALSWSDSTSNPNSVIDTILARDAANTLALRNGTNAQTFNVYGTYTDASNYERLRVVSGSSYELICEAAGTGTARGLQLKAGSGNNLSFGGNGAAQWRVNFSGHLEAITDNVSDIGASGANRPRNVHVAGTVIPGRGVTVAGLPTPSTGMIARVTDALAPTIGATVTGGGAAYALVNYNGANWTVIGV